MESAVQQSNPLKQYFRSIKLYLKLPSGNKYYKPEVINFNEQNEVGVLPMTGADELALKNPDALLNGEALIGVLTSCVPALKQPRSLLTNDIDALITAIRYATFNDSLETELYCPACGHHNKFSLDLQYALDNMTELESEYIAYLDNGLSVFVKPYAFPEILKDLHSQFERTKLARSIESENTPSEKRSEVFTTTFKNMAILKFELMTSSIVKVVNEQDNINVTEPKFIKEFLQNIDTKSANKITDLIAEINKIGIRRTFTAKCEKCSHEWESEIDFNPVNFS